MVKYQNKKAADIKLNAGGLTAVCWSPNGERPIWTIQVVTLYLHCKAGGILICLYLEKLGTYLVG